MQLKRSNYWLCMFPRSAACFSYVRFIQLTLLCCCGLIQSAAIRGPPAAALIARCQRSGGWCTRSIPKYVTCKVGSAEAESGKGGISVFDRYDHPLIVVDKCRPLGSDLMGVHHPWLCVIGQADWRRAPVVFLTSTTIPHHAAGPASDSRDLPTKYFEGLGVSRLRRNTSRASSLGLLRSSIELLR
jgi:hypothetical protein